MIDQTRSLARDPSLRDKRFKGCSRTMYEGLESLSASDVERELGPYLGTYEIKALLKRRDKLVKLINAQIEKKGESKVLFDYSDPPEGLVITYDD